MAEYMIVERFKDGCIEQVYDRFNRQGRMLPDGLMYKNSWVSKDNNLCFQLMETTDESLFTLWIREWEDLVDFDIYPVN